jgi:hypothetical protein
MSARRIAAIAFAGLFLARSAAAFPGAGREPGETPRTSAALFSRGLEERGEGKTATAYHTLEDALYVALHEKGAKDRVRLIRRELSTLKPILTYMAVSTSGDAAQTKIAIDGDRRSCEYLPCSAMVDPGEHQVSASLPGKKSWEKTILVSDQGADISVPDLTTWVEEPTMPLPPELPPDADKKVIPQEPLPPTTITLGMSPAAVLRTGSYESGSSAITTFRASYTRFNAFSPFLRMGVAFNAPISGGAAGALSNPVAGFQSSFQATDWLGLRFSGLAAIPVGSSSDNPAIRAASREGVGLGGRLFDVDYFSATLGLDVDLVPGDFGFVVKNAVTKAVKTRGDQDVDPDKTSLFSALQVNYSPLRSSRHGGFLFFAEGRAVVWLSTPSFVAKDPTEREDLYAGGGVQWTARTRNAAVFSTSLAFFRAVDAPLANTGYNQVETDFSISW